MIIKLFFQQVVFYLEKDLYCQRGDMIEGEMKMAPNARNPRDLDISIESTLVTQDERSINQTMEYKMH